jgi:hypothetical protein
MAFTVPAPHRAFVAPAAAVAAVSERATIEAEAINRRIQSPP